MSRSETGSWIQIKNIAVCMYGQYRTGDACIEYLKKFYDIEGVNVDFFCSLKEYETTYTRESYNMKTYGEEYSREQSPLSSDAVAYQTQQIHKHYNPKKFKIYSTEYEEGLKGIEQSIMQSKVLAGWADVIMLKQKYEADNNMSYDLVIMQRYDVVVWPTHAFRTIISSLTDNAVDERITFSTSDKNLILMQPIEIVRRYTNTLMYPNGQDLYVMGVGNALDVLVYDALEHIPSKHSNNHSIHKLNTGYPQVDTHEMIASIPSKMNITTSLFPYVAKYTPGIYHLPLGLRNTDHQYSAIAPFPVRAAYWPNNIIPELEKLTNEELEQEYDKFISIGWRNRV